MDNILVDLLSTNIHILTFDFSLSEILSPAASMYTSMGDNGPGRNVWEEEGSQLLSKENSPEKAKRKRIVVDDDDDEFNCCCWYKRCRRQCHERGFGDIADFLCECDAYDIVGLFCVVTLFVLGGMTLWWVWASMHYESVHLSWSSTSNDASDNSHSFLSGFLSKDKQAINNAGAPSKPSSSFVAPKQDAPQSNWFAPWSFFNRNSLPGAASGGGGGGGSPPKSIVAAVTEDTETNKTAIMYYTDKYVHAPQPSYLPACFQRYDWKRHTLHSTAWCPFGTVTTTRCNILMVLHGGQSSTSKPSPRTKTTNPSANLRTSIPL